MKEQDIVHLIKKDHIPLKQAIAILKSDEKTDSQKKKALKDFLRNLELHAKAEEKALYENAENESEVRSSVLEGYEEHEVADTFILELKALDFENHWNDFVAAKAKVLAEMVEHHVLEEESELLPEIEDVYTKAERIQLGEVYSKSYQLLSKAMLKENIVPATEENALMM